MEAILLIFNPQKSKPPKVEAQEVCVPQRRTLPALLQITPTSAKPGCNRGECSLVLTRVPCCGSTEMAQVRRHLLCQLALAGDKLDVPELLGYPLEALKAVLADGQSDGQADQLLQGQFQHLLSAQLLEQGVGLSCVCHTWAEIGREPSERTWLRQCAAARDVSRLHMPAASRLHQAMSLLGGAR